MRDRRSVKWTWLGTRAVIIAALAVGLVFVVHDEVGGGSSGSIHHLDGQGPLGSTGDPTANSSFTFDSTSGSGPWTVGYLVCLVQGTGPAIIESVGPAHATGNGYRYIGAMVRELDPEAGGAPLIETDGYPPKVRQALRPAVGYAVAAPCASDTRRYTELDLGFARAPGVEGGGWTGINVGYRVGSQQYVVTLGYNVYMCGPAVPDPQLRGCYPGPPPTPTSAG